MSHTLKNVYDYYCLENKNSVSKEIFRDICQEFNMMIFDYILEGGSFNMGFNLSTLSVVRIERNPSKPVIDWGESNKYKKELLDNNEKLYDHVSELGKKWYIYYTDPFYCRYYWRKGKCSVPNKSAYRFDATRGIKGNKEKLINILKEDDLAYLKFRKN